MSTLPSSFHSLSLSSTPPSFHFYLFHATSQAENCAFEIRRERERVSAAGKVRGPETGFQLAPNRITLFPWHSAAPRLGRETGKRFFPQTAEMILIACDINRFDALLSVLIEKFHGIPIEKI